MMESELSVYRSEHNAASMVDAISHYSLKPRTNTSLLIALSDHRTMRRPVTKHLSYFLQIRQEYNKI